MKSMLKILFGVLFLAGAGMAMADEDHHDERGGARVIIVPAHHYYRHHKRHYHRRPVVHSKVELKVGIGGDRHDDHR